MSSFELSLTRQDFHVVLCIVITVGSTAVESQHQHQWCLDKSALLFACKFSYKGWLIMQKSSCSSDDHANPLLFTLMRL